jgi:hypothetical protein
MANSKLRTAIYCCSVLATFTSFQVEANAQENQAEPPKESAFSVRGFGTLGLTKTNTQDALYRADWRNAGGAGRNWDASVDSKLGLQADWEINDAIMLTAQTVAAKDASGKYNPKLDWLYASYWVNPDFAVRVGRTRIPTFTHSDYYNVGNAYLWARPPVDVYNQLSFFSVDGIDLVYEYHADDFSLLVQPVIGKSKFDLYFSIAGGRLQGDVDNVRGINTTLQTGPVSFRFGMMRGQLTVKNRPAELENVANGLQAASNFYPDAAKLAEKFGIVNRHAQFTSFGASYDGKDIILLSEFTKRKTGSIMPDSTAWYLSGGIKRGAWTPYLTYSAQRIDSPRQDTSIPSVGPFASLYKTVNSVLAYPVDTKTTALGLRFEYSPKILLKTELENIQGGISPLPGHPQPNNVKVISFVVDFIF